MRTITPIKNLTPFTRPYTNYCGIGERIRGKFLYKYMPLETAITCLKNNTIRFVEPSLWHDPFEKLYYSADYSNVMPSPAFKTRFHACCLTSKPFCEASWRIYTDDSINNPCVQFKIYIGQFRRFLEAYAKKHNANVYEGRVRYDITEYDICHLYQRTHRLYPLFFDGFDITKYLNLMLLKRKFFEYENEIRFFIHVANTPVNYLDIKIPWSHCLDSIVLPPLSDNAKGGGKIKEELEEALINNYSLCKSEFSSVYPQTIKPKPNTLYKEIVPIVIERKE